MTKDKVILLGGGGHCKSVIEAIESEGKLQIAGILDSPDKVGQVILGYLILGTDDDLARLIKEVPNVVITVGQLKNAGKRLALFNFAKSLGAVLPNIIAATAYVSRHCTLGEGTVVLHKAFINAGALIGVNNIINTGAIIEHDVKVGNHNHIATGALINGDCEVGDQIFIGSNSVLKQGIKVADSAIVGAGSVVLNTIYKPGIFVGNPAKEK